MASRIQGSAEPAERALRVLVENPGCDIAAVARGIGTDHSTAAYHLRHLVRRGEASAVRVGRSVAHYVAGCGICPLVRRAIPRLGGLPHALGVVRALEGRAPLRACDVGHATGVGIGPARWVIGAAVAAGLVARVGYGRFALVDGADVCVDRVASRSACDRWRTCVPGARWREGAGGASRRDCSGARFGRGG